MLTLTAVSSAPAAVAGGCDVTLVTSSFILGDVHKNALVVSVDDIERASD